jgi:hypothetical protein
MFRTTLPNLLLLVIQNFVFLNRKCYNLAMRATLFIFFLSFTLIWGCGGSSKSSHKQHRTTPRKSNPEIARQTEKSTKGHKGSWSLTSDQVKGVSRYVENAARKNALPEDLIYGVIWVESRFNPRAVSPVGARGLMQLMPKTAKYLADCIAWRGRANAFDPEFNIAAGSYYIARLIKQFDGDQRLALAAYNAGPGNVRSWMNNNGRLPPVSVEYSTMVQTARSFFGSRLPDRSATPPEPSTAPPARGESQIAITDGDLDRLGLAILIAGLGDKQFGLDRPDDANPVGE